MAAAAALAAGATYVVEHAGWIGDGDPEHFGALVVGAGLAGALAFGGHVTVLAREAIDLLRELSEIQSTPKHDPGS